MSHDKFIQRGAASLAVDTNGPARVFNFLLLPKLTMLAFSAAVEPLRIANQLAQKTLYEWYTVTPNGGPVTCSNGVTITPDMAMGDLQKGVTVFVCSGVEPHKTTPPEVTAWLRRHARLGVRLGASVQGLLPWPNLALLAKTDSHCTGKTNRPLAKPIQILYPPKIFTK